MAEDPTDYRNDRFALPPLPVAQWDPALQSVIDDMRGKPLQVHSLMANHPALLAAWWDYRKYIVADNALDKRHAELVILRVAVQMGTWYEWASHVDRALSRGLSLDEINRVIQGPDATGWPVAERLLLNAVDELGELRRISKATLGAMSGHYSKQQLLDLIAIHGVYTTLGGMINTWELDLDDDVAARLPESITREDFSRASRTGNS